MFFRAARAIPVLARSGTSDVRQQQVGAHARNYIVHHMSVEVKEKVTADWPEGGGGV